MMDSLAHLDRHGFAVLQTVFSVEERAAMIVALTRCCAAHDPAVRSGDDVVYAARDLLRVCPFVERWWRVPQLVDFVTAVLGPRCGLVRGLLFDKPPQQTWAVPWHKDRAIVVRRPESPSPRYSPARLKTGLWHCEPPLEILQNMLALRIHLDPSTEENGPLEVLPGSHRDFETAGATRGQPVRILVAAGDVLAMRPLLDHASPRSQPGTTLHRRVIHLEFSGDLDLPDGYRWHEFHPVCQRSSPDLPVDHKG